MPPKAEAQRTSRPTEVDAASAIVGLSGDCDSAPSETDDYEGAEAAQRDRVLSLSHGLDLVGTGAVSVGDGSGSGSGSGGGGSGWGLSVQGPSALPPQPPHPTSASSPSSSFGSSSRARVPRPLPCEACRSQRKKCSTAKPACDRCLETNTPCVYAVTDKRYVRRIQSMRGDQTKLEASSPSAEPHSMTTNSPPHLADLTTLAQKYQSEIAALTRRPLPCDCCRQQKK
ncbi:hypothetical protein HDU99_009247, partial [Rhizoclosmatium hyalinum]